jgi:flagellar biosynthesis protein
MSESRREERDYREIRAAALKYNSEQDNAPVVVAAGNGYVAGKIIEIADECGITVYHDDSAATMLSKLNLGQEIPSELYRMVVDIYVAVLSASDAIKEKVQ